jgi:hypothetical protein
MDSPDYIVAAVRVLVGSTSRTVPRYVKVLGRSHDMTVGVKRWYTIMLSAQEIAYAVRNGFISLDIGPCHDSTCNPALNSVEVYALERRKIELWFPVTLQSVFARCADSVDCDENTNRLIFRLCIQTLAGLNKMVGGAKVNPIEKAFIQQLLSATAIGNDKLVYDSITSLLSSFESDDEMQQYSVDSAVLSGCSVFLSKCKRCFESARSYNDVGIDNWRLLSLIPSLRACLRTAALVARLRPFNYLQAVDGSIVDDASSITIECLNHSSSAELVADFVELSLLESAVANGTPRGRFGSLDGIRSLILSVNKHISSKTCASISRFCKVSNMFTAQTMAVKYVCDNCLLFINDIRFTELEKEHAFDLCPTCYGLALKYAEKSGKNDIMINGKFVGESPKLSCGEVFMMKPVLIHKLSAVSDSAAASYQPDLIPVGEVAHQQQLFNDFMDGLIAGISSLLADQLKNKGYLPGSLIWLSVDLIRHSFQSERRIERGKELLIALLVGLHIRLPTTGDEDTDVFECILLLEGLISTLVLDETVREFCLFNDKGFVSTDAHVDYLDTRCTIHNEPVGYYKFSAGKDKDQTFVACSREPKKKCTFFVWTNKDEGQQEGAKACLFDQETANLVWQLLTTTLTHQETPLYIRLSSFVERFSNMHGKQGGSTSSKKDCRLHDISGNLQKEFSDGVICSNERLRSDLSLRDTITLFQKLRPTKNRPRLNGTQGMSLLMEKLLELLSHVASPDAVNGDQWYPALCRLSASEKGQTVFSSRLRLLAWRSIWQLCGKDTILSHVVRDHYVFTFHFEKLLRHTDDLLDSCVMLNEKTRVCGPQWKSSQRCSFGEMKVRHIVGIEALVSEDSTTLKANEVVTRILGDIITLAEKRCGSWRRYCGLRAFSADALPVATELRPELLAASPLMTMFVLACSTSIENQVLSLRMINLALSRPGESKSAPSTERKSTYDHDHENIDVSAIYYPTHYCPAGTPESILDVSIDDVFAFVMSFVCRGASPEVQKASLSVANKLFQCLDQTSQGVLLDRLLSGPLCRVGCMGKHCFYFFTLLQLLARSVSLEVIDVNRSIAAVQSFLKLQILATRHDKANGDIFHVETKFGTSSKTKRFDLAGCTSCRTKAFRGKSEKTLSASSGDRATSLTSRPATDTLCLAKIHLLPEQVSSFTRVHVEMSRDFSTSSEFCSYVALKHRCVISTIHVEVESPRRFVKTISFYFAPRPVDGISILKSDTFAGYWQPCGVLTLTRGGTRSSLVLATPVVAANLKIEYTDFYERSGSTKSSDGTLVVLCPRCTRAVTNAHGVCGNCGEVAFQCRKCRHINYDRLDAFLCVECGFCASASFRYDLTAAVATNAIAITNDQDYKKASSRIKLASQLHEEIRSALKDKLRVLVSCGPRQGSNASFDDCMNGFSALRQAFEDIIPLNEIKDDPRINKTKLILSELGIPGSIVKLIATATSKGNDNTAGRLISLFRSTSGRGEGRTSDRTSTSTNAYFIRDLSRDVLMAGADDDEAVAASELFSGILESTSIGGTGRYSGLDANDPLSRLLASVQSRRERRAEESLRNRSDSAITAGAESSESNNPTTNQNANSCNNTPTTATKEKLDICDRLYRLLRETECEVYELERRCAAWRRLNGGCLYSTIEEVSQRDHVYHQFEPSHCSSCASTIVIQLFILWLRLFQLHPSSVIVQPEMISLLFDADPTAVIHEHSITEYKHLQKTKRAIIQEIVLRSVPGSALVLETLRLRLTVLQDRNAAEILGQILESFATTTDTDVVTSVAPFVELAHEALKANV